MGVEHVRMINHNNKLINSYNLCLICWAQHLSDLPIILSGDYLAVLEPTEAIFHRSPGRKWNLKDDWPELSRYPDQVIKFYQLLNNGYIFLLKPLFCTKFSFNRQMHFGTVGAKDYPTVR